MLPIRDSEKGLVVASKPPFFHWLGAVASVVAGGPTELTVRAPSIVLGTGAVLLVWLVGRTLLTPSAAFAGAVVLATTVEWVRTVSSARVDGTLVALMTAGLLLFYRGFIRGGLSRPEALAAYGCFACATLTKGPVGFVLPGLVLGTALVWQGKVREIPRFHPVLGIVMILSVTSAWYLAAWHFGGEAFFERQVLKENVFRFLGASRMKSGHEHPVYYYVPALLAGFLPWTPFLIAALVRAVRSGAARREPRDGLPADLDRRGLRLLLGGIRQKERLPARALPPGGPPDRLVVGRVAARAGGATRGSRVGDPGHGGYRRRGGIAADRADARRTARICTAGDSHTAALAQGPGQSADRPGHHRHPLLRHPGRSRDHAGFVGRRDWCPPTRALVGVLHRECLAGHGPVAPGVRDLPARARAPANPQAVLRRGRRTQRRATARLLSRHLRSAAPPSTRRAGSPTGTAIGSTGLARTTCWCGTTIW